MSARMKDKTRNARDADAEMRVIEPKYRHYVCCAKICPSFFLLTRIELEGRCVVSQRINSNFVAVHGLRVSCDATTAVMSD